MSVPFGKMEGSNKNPKKTAKIHEKYKAKNALNRCFNERLNLLAKALIVDNQIFNYVSPEMLNS